MYRALLPLARLGRFSLVPFAALLLAVGMTACQPGSDAGGSEAAADSASAPPVVDVTAADYAFAAPDTIPAGWVTFRMTNKGTESHHFHLRRLLEGATVTDWREAVKEPLDSVNQLRAEGKIDSADARKALMKAFDRATPDSIKRLRDLLPQTRGGVGLVAPGRTGQATHRVEPGHYVMICLVRAPSGRRHSSLGMASGLVAVESSSERLPPEPDVTVRAAGRDLAVEGEFETGENTVRFVVDSVPDVPDSTRTAWLARLDSSTSAEDLADWIMEGSRLPAPAPFLGGFEYYPASDPIHFTVDLEPARYGLLWGYRGQDPEPLTFTVE